MNFRNALIAPRQALYCLSATDGLHAARLSFPLTFLSFDDLSSFLVVSLPGNTSPTMSQHTQDYTNDGLPVYTDTYTYTYDPQAYPVSPPPSSHSPSSRPPRSSSLHANPQLAQRPTTPRYASTAEAIAHFRPTPREVISGIAPHVFDERRRRRTSAHRRTQSAGVYGAGATAGYEGAGQGYVYHSRRSSGSPLKGGAVISWDERGVYVEHDKVIQSEPGHGMGDARDELAMRQDKGKRKGKGWRYLRVDVQLFK